MTSLSPSAFINQCVQSVRTGSFITLARNQETLKQLQRLNVSGRGYIGIQSCAILAEIYDQIGDYAEARKLADTDIGKTQLRKLKEEITKTNSERDIVRAHAWLLLQCAVSGFRREHGVDDAISLLERGIELISEYSKAIDSLHIQSLFHFWLGRMRSTARYEFKKADVAFQRALDVADQTLDEKLRALDEKRQQAGKALDEATWKLEHDRHMAAGTYVLSTIMSFGLAQARQLDSKLQDSLWFLRAAVPLARGSDDVHRRGFAHLLIGTALRGIASREKDDELKKADEQLKLAKTLFESSQPHRLHLARVYHQLSLSQYNRVPPGSEAARVNGTHLVDALKNSDEAAKLNDGYGEFKDPLLAYGVKVTQSLIKTALERFDEGHEHAVEAIETLRRNVPRGTHGWAKVAKGLARAEQVRSQSSSYDDEITKQHIREAESDLLGVAEDAELRPTDRAAALLHLSRLYSSISEPFKAEIHLKRAEPFVEGSEHGWLKDLQKAAKAALKGDSGPELRINVEDLFTSSRDKVADDIAKGNRKPGSPWKYMNQVIDVDVKRRLLAVGAHQELLEKPDGEDALAKELGITRATLFSWKRDPKLKDFFPKKKAATKKLTENDPDRGD